MNNRSSLIAKFCNFADISRTKKKGGRIPPLPLPANPDFPSFFPLDNCRFLCYNESVNQTSIFCRCHHRRLPAMPFIETKLNIRLTPEKEANIKEKLGKAISLFPGKSEYWLMLRFEDNCRMWFRGYNSFPIAMVQVQLFGSAEAAITEQMTAEICRILSEELSVQPDHIYINYSFSETWGWNNENF